MSIVGRFAVAFYVVFLASCGGGGGGSSSTPPPTSGSGTDTTISGVAAVGAPLVSASISLNCTGFSGSGGTTNNSGFWQAIVPTINLPCLVRASGGTVGVGGVANTQTLYSFGGSASNPTINITPATMLALGRATATAIGSSDLAAVFNGTYSAPTLSQLATATENETLTLQTAMTAAGYSWPVATSGTFNPFTSPFTPAPGNSYDDLIASLMASLNASSGTLSTLVTSYATSITVLPTAIVPHQTGWGTIATVFDRGNYGSFETTSIKFDDNGNALAVWGTSQSIWANRYTAGLGWGEAVQISPASSNSAYAAYVSMDIDGNGLATWRDEDGDGNQSVWVNRYTAGQGWGLATRISPFNSLYNVRVSNVGIGYFLSGTPLIVWAQFDNSGRSLWNCVYSAATGACTAPANQFATNAEEPSIGNDALGNLVIAWHKLEYSSGSIWAIHHGYGMGWGDPTLIMGTISDGQLRYPKVHFCSNFGSGFIGWKQLLFNNAGDSVWGEAFEIIDGAFVPAIRDHLQGPEGFPCINASGHYFAAWRVDDNAHATESVWAYHQSISDDGDVAEKISADMASITGPLIAHDAQGHALAVWLQYDGTSHELMASHYAPDTGWSSATLIPNTGYPDTFSLTHDAATEEMVLVWTKGARIFSSRFSM